jgi:prolyl 4-hydroxylase
MMELNQAWIDWIRTNIARGCHREDMIKSMVGSGFKPDVANFCIDQVLQAPQPYVLEPRLTLDGNVIDCGDRSCTVAFHCTDPEIAFFNDFLSAEECDQLVRESAAKLLKSTVIDNDTGDRVEHHQRISDGTWFNRGENEFVSMIERRIAKLTNSEVHNGEGLQILYYKQAGRYDPHHDYFPANVGGEVHMRTGGQRVATFIMYLNDVEAGGETIFPTIKLKFMPRKGSAVYFSYTNSTGQTDERTLHGGAPVLRGEKWISTKWIRVGQPPN